MGALKIGKFEYHWQYTFKENTEQQEGNSPAAILNTY